MAAHHPARGVIAWLLAASLGGCASDQIAPRVVQYNRVSETVHNQLMLLNVLRASQRRPLEFTALQTITGTGSLEAESRLGVPLVQNGAEEALDVAQRLTYSERPTFSVNVLDTQEFYQGILRPLSTQTLDFYLKRGLSRRLLFDLFFSSVSLRADTPGAQGKSFTAQFDNDVTDDERFDDYQALIEALLNAGLTTTAIRPPPVVLGPPLTAEEVVRGDYAAKAAAGGFELKAVGWCGLDASERSDLAARLGLDPGFVDRLRAGCSGADPAAPGALWPAKAPRTVFRLEKTAGPPAFVLCVQPSDRANRLAETTCGALPRRPAAAPAAEGGVQINFEDAPPDVCATLNRRRVRGRPLDCKGGIALEFTFTARSTYEIIRYLGEVVRRANEPASGQAARTIAVKMKPTDLPISVESTATAAPPAICNAGLGPGAVTADGFPCLPLFAVQRGKAPATAFVAARYGGEAYFVAAPEAGRAEAEPALQVFQLLTELLALNRSAKDLPATAAFTIVAP